MEQFLSNILKCDLFGHGWIVEEKCSQASQKMRLWEGGSTWDQSRMAEAGEALGCVLLGAKRRWSRDREENQWETNSYCWGYRNNGKWQHKVMKMNICTYEYIIAKSLVNVLEFILTLPLKCTLRIQNSPLAIRDELALEQLDYALSLVFTQLN